MVKADEAVRLWEDTVGDSGESPTGDDLYEYANAVHKQAIQPAIDLAEEWIKRADEIKEKADHLYSTGQRTLGHALTYRERAYRHLASELLRTLTVTE